LEKPEKPRVDVHLSLDADVYKAFRSVCEIGYTTITVEQELKAMVECRAGWGASYRRAKIIRKLNDEFRRSAVERPGITFMGDVEKLLDDKEMGSWHKRHILEEIRACDQFEDYEHKIGTFTRDGIEMCFVIGYYDREDVEMENPDPTDPRVTWRGMRVMSVEDFNEMNREYADQVLSREDDPALG